MYPFLGGGGGEGTHSRICLGWRVHAIHGHYVHTESTSCGSTFFRRGLVVHMPPVPHASYAPVDSETFPNLDAAETVLI